MEGIQTINALKAVISSLPAQTTIPSGELVTLYAADGTPIAKISRDDLVKAVASVMASNSQNTFSKLLGVQANGTPMGIGASDLASVLGVCGNASSYYPETGDISEDAVIRNNFALIPQNKEGMFFFSQSWGGLSGGYSMILFCIKVTPSSSDVRPIGLFISRAKSTAFLFEIYGSSVEKFII